MGSMYAAVTFIGVENAATVQPLIAVERTVFYRERAAGMYSALPYAIAQASNLSLAQFLHNFRTIFLNLLYFPPCEKFAL